MLKPAAMAEGGTHRVDIPVAEGGAGALQHLAQLRHRRQAVQLDVLVVLRGHSGGSGAVAVSALRWVGGGTEGHAPSG